MWIVRQLHLISNQVKSRSCICLNPKDMWSIFRWVEAIFIEVPKDMWFCFSAASRAYTMLIRRGANSRTLSRGYEVLGRCTYTSPETSNRIEYVL
jgi:hypothetical protein